jgi:hemin uptake protein HemP
MVDTCYENDYCSLCVSPKPTHQDQRGADTPRITSEALLGTRKELVIMHNGREYLLRQTQNRKLILTA